MGGAQTDDDLTIDFNTVLESIYPSPLQQAHSSGFLSIGANGPSIMDTCTSCRSSHCCPQGGSSPLVITLCCQVYEADTIGKPYTLAVR